MRCPLRVMIYDGMGYLKECQEITRPSQEDERPYDTGGISLRTAQEDRLHPIITIVIYYSEKPWDGPLSLKDMVMDMPPELERVFSDYKINLLQAAKK